MSASRSDASLVPIFEESPRPRRSRTSHSPRRSPRKSSRSSYVGKLARSLKVTRILKDIAEARSLGIELSELSLNEMYASLQDARRQRAEYERQHPGRTFKYDSGEHRQLPYNDDGLDELKNMIIEEHKAKESTRNASATVNRKRAR